MGEDEKDMEEIINELEEENVKWEAGYNQSYVDFQEGYNCKPFLNTPYGCGYSCGYDQARIEHRRNS